MPSIVEPAALVAGAGEDLVDRLPEPQGAIAHRHFRGDGQSAGLDVNEQFPPALRAFADPDMEAKEFLPALGRRPDDHQNTFCFRFHPRLQVDPVSPDVDVAARREITVLPAIVFLLPTGGEACDDAGRQVRGVRPKDRRQRFLEIAGGDATQVKHRQQSIEASGPTRPFRQEVRGEADLRLDGQIRRPVAHFLTPYIDRANPGLDHPFRPGTVPHHTLAAIGKPVFGKLRDKAVGLRFQRRHQHAPRPIPGDLGQRINDRTRLAEGDDRGIVCQRRIAPPEVLAGFEHPPRYAAFSNPITQIHA